MKTFFDSQWVRTKNILTPGTLRIGLAVFTLLALVLGGQAGDHWT